MNIRDYIANAEKTFKFQIKTLFPLGSEEMDLLEKALFKYRPASISKPKKTMFQAQPLGFTGVKNSEVYIVNVELTVPTTSFVLQGDLRDQLRLHKDAKELKVFSDLSDQVGEELNTIGGDLKDEDGKTIQTQLKDDNKALLTQPNYEEVEEAKWEDNYGEAYNTKFLAYLKKVEAERKEKRKAGPVDAMHPITKWADQPKADGDQDAMSKDGKKATVRCRKTTNRIQSRTLRSSKWTSSTPFISNSATRASPTMKSRAVCACFHAASISFPASWA
jgi:hypothetical protein